MKKYLIWLLVMVLSLSVAFMGISCKTAAPAEAAEEESGAEEATEHGAAVEAAEGVVASMLEAIDLVQKCKGYRGC